MGEKKKDERKEGREGKGSRWVNVFRRDSKSERTSTHIHT